MSVVVGSLNMDFIVKVKRIPIRGETILTQDSYLMQPGGKGANQAFTIGRLGGKVAMVGKVGIDPLGQLLKQNLQNATVNVDSVSQDPDHATGVAFITVDQQGQNSIVVSSGANGQLSASEIEESDSMLRKSDFLLTQLEVPLHVVLLALQTAKSYGVTTILDPAPARPLSAELLRLVDILTPNESEALTLIGEEPREINRDEAPAIAQKLLAMGAGSVILKLGSKGVLLARKDHDPILIGATPVDAVDTTAAGDIFNGALTVALKEMKSLADAVYFGNIAAGYSVTKLGAQASAPSQRELETFTSTIR
jgi:ribokinase